MNEIKLNTKDILEFRKKIGKPFDIILRGDSMLPLIMDKDIVSVRFSKEYSLGDIVLFSYKDEGELIHRIIKKQNNLFYCKGDNAFRIESITEQNIIGIVTKVTRGSQEIQIKKLSLLTKKILCYLSMRVNYLFIKHDRNIQICRMSLRFRTLRYLLNKLN
ncbi:S24/S26 family peptidase [Vallitalea guaymasensis]|uniref:S24/S26 family peptidase n=1 Tax=Vallitalea guaymasensis TaxID=1185412 RepID=UPI000DE34876|nr:S24/S26 family peptidase [Vallitalea guaymasensis]